MTTAVNNILTRKCLVFGKPSQKIEYKTDLVWIINIGQNILDLKKSFTHLGLLHGYIVNVV